MAKESIKYGFIPISINAYVEAFMKINPKYSRKAILDSLKSALQDYKAGAKCTCGNPIWVIGSALAGNACFTCITGEADPSEDYEIDEAC